MIKKSRECYRVTGFVQGVGFRPFVYRIAHECGVSGFVRNLSWGVEIEAQGDEEQLERFEDALRNKLPPLAEIHLIEKVTGLESCATQSGSDFKIVESGEAIAEAALISPDVATCPDCLRELNDPTDRRYQYPFINCTNCGPRFTIIKEVPYDRAKTTMREFTLCPECGSEYRNPLDRRFHAEPVACPVCGPGIWATGNGRQVTGKDGIERTIEALRSGRIVAIKGLGGFHLACDATNEDAVKRLRERKGRPYKPLAVMMPNIETVKKYCGVTEAEAKELESYRQPILLLKKGTGNREQGIGLVEGVSPGLNEVGVMLPYTPLHHLIFTMGGFSALVMTSGNRSEEPIVIDNDEAQTKLSDIADDFLLHNRGIWNRCDDSVGYFRGEQLVLTRRSRGFAPRPVMLPFYAPPMLAVGAQYCNVFALAQNKRVFLSQHIGDVDNSETLSFLRESVDKLKRWLGIDPEVIVHDLHPDLLTTGYAQEIADGKRLIAVQHHHAHFASALIANSIEEPSVGIVFDGTGYGEDRTIWGGEFFIGDAKRVERVGHLMPLPLPGGDAAIRKPARTTIAFLHHLLPTYDLPGTIKNAVGKEEIEIVRQMVDKKFNTIPTSSVGRLFDAVSALLGVCYISTYEGQAAIELEHLAHRSENAIRVMKKYALHFSIQRTQNRLIINPSVFLRGLTQAIEANEPSAQLGLAFHIALADVSCDIAETLVTESGLKKVALCGGVFQNRLLTSLIAKGLQKRGLEPVLPGLIPVNDGGISLGQVAVAMNQL